MWPKCTTTFHLPCFKHFKTFCPYYSLQRNHNLMITSLASIRDMANSNSGGRIYCSWIFISIQDCKESSCKFGSAHNPESRTCGSHGGVYEELTIWVTMQYSMLKGSFLIHAGFYKKKLSGLSPQANYTNRATAACQRSWCQLLQIGGATWSAWRIPTVKISVFLTGASTFSSK
jgi:hypothetical protein